MSEQQYRVIADRDKGDDPNSSDAQPGDKVIREFHGDDVWRDAEGTVWVRQEQLVEAVESTLSSRPSPPTREQIAEALDRDGLVAVPKAAVNSLLAAHKHTSNAAALLQKGADR